jgi:hypothetical protein
VLEVVEEQQEVFPAQGGCQALPQGDRIVLIDRQTLGDGGEHQL